MTLSPIKPNYMPDMAVATPFDMQMLMHLLTNMRMVCNSSQLVDEKSNDSTKLEELKDILLEKLDLLNNKRKVIIISE